MGIVIFNMHPEFKMYVWNFLIVVVGKIKELDCNSKLSLPYVYSAAPVEEKRGLGVPEGDHPWHVTWVVVHSEVENGNRQQLHQSWIRSKHETSFAPNTLLHIKITWRASTMPCAQAAPQNNWTRILGRWDQGIGVLKAPQMTPLCNQNREPLLQVTCVGGGQKGGYLGLEGRKLKSAEVQWFVEDHKWQLWHNFLTGFQTLYWNDLSGGLSHSLIILEFYRELLPENNLFQKDYFGFLKGQGNRNIQAKWSGQMFEWKMPRKDVSLGSPSFRDSWLVGTWLGALQPIIRVLLLVLSYSGMQGGTEMWRTTQVLWDN